MRHGTLDLIVTAEWARSEVFVSCADCLHHEGRGERAGVPWVMCCLQQTWCNDALPCTPERPGTVTTYCSPLTHDTHQLLAPRSRGNPENYLLCKIIGLSWKALPKLIQDQPKPKLI